VLSPITASVIQTVIYRSFLAGSNTLKIHKKSPSAKLGLKFREETSKKGNKGKGQKTFRLLQCNN